MWAGQRADLIIARVQDVRAAGIALVALIACLLAVPYRLTPSEDSDLYADTWVATDALGRSLPGYAEVGPPRQRQEGIFYFLWVNQAIINHGDGPVWDNTRIPPSIRRSRAGGR